MKLSRRGKSARRGRHTKRAGKHHTHHIKYRDKQYKRTYRKNNRKYKKLTHGRSLRGGKIVTFPAVQGCEHGCYLYHTQSTESGDINKTEKFTFDLSFDDDNDLFTLIFRRSDGIQITVVFKLSNKQIIYGYDKVFVKETGLQNVKEDNGAYTYTFPYIVLDDSEAGSKGTPKNTPFFNQLAKYLKPLFRI